MFDPNEDGTRRYEGPRPRAVLVGVRLPDTDDTSAEASLTELGRLADTLGLDVIGQVSQRRNTLSVSTVLGEGKLRELAALTGGPGEVPGYVPAGRDAPPPPELANALPVEERARVVVVDHDLSPRQMRNLEKATGAEVLDRSMVVVSIFQRHARSREARLQVEIARLAYLAPRLREAGAGQDRQRGGIGGKGAGESSLELGRRQIRDRIAALRRELKVVMHAADTQRNRRAESAKVAVVGYTNAGKSSLMRKLTGDPLYVADQLFATLDTTVRLLQPPTRPPILVSDTVGFIKNLPHDLVASFRSTLQEARDASLLLHLVDASDPAFRDQLRVTREVLADIGIRTAPDTEAEHDTVPDQDPDAGQGTDPELAPHRLVLNKADLLDDAQRRALAAEFPGAILISAHDEQDVRALHGLIVDFFEQDMVEQEFVLPYSQQAQVAMLHERCRVLSEQHDEAGTTIRVRAPRSVLGGIAGVIESESGTPR